MGRKSSLSDQRLETQKILFCRRFSNHHIGQNQNDLLREYLTCRDHILRMMAKRHSPPEVRRCIVCNRESSMEWRCHGCFGEPVFCTECLKLSHQARPFHKVSKWSGRYFEPSTLSEADVTLNLCHNGSLCPSYVQQMVCVCNTLQLMLVPNFSKACSNEGGSSQPSMDVEPNISAQPSYTAMPDPFFTSEDDGGDDLADISIPTIGIKSQRVSRAFDAHQCPIIVVVDISGVHQLRVRPCRCEFHGSTPIFDQFLLSGLYPASTDKTRTVFTFRVLNDYHLDNLESKSTASKYYEKLRRLTSNLFPHTVPDRYRELMGAARQWRDLKLRQRAGMAYDRVDAISPGSLVLFCPACPQPNVNLPTDWKKDKDQ